MNQTTKPWLSGLALHRKSSPVLSKPSGQCKVKRGSFGVHFPFLKLSNTLNRKDLIMKYEITSNSITSPEGITLYQIRALVDIQLSYVRAGELGGYIGSERNLSQDGSCWVSDQAMVYQEAKVSGDARVFGISRVYGKARIFGAARVFGKCKIHGSSRVFGNSKVCGNAEVFDSVEIFGEASVFGNAKVCGTACLYGTSCVAGKGFVNFPESVVWFSNVGPDLGTLTVYPEVNGTLLATRKTFTGTVEAFMELSSLGCEPRVYEEYKLLIQMATLRLTPA